MCLMFLPGGSSGSASSASVGRAASAVSGAAQALSKQTVKNQKIIDNQQLQINNLKRKLEAGSAWQPQKGPKGGGKGNKKGTKGGNVIRSPAEWGDLPSTMPDGTRICFAYNKQSGCPLASPGQSCFKGIHLCPKCHEPHCFAERHMTGA